ncbi:MAG: hypothetical protein IJ471_09305 [Eubacterium sp.]|nr:hypothetical protein [Eubacterium sp.]
MKTILSKKDSGMLDQILPLIVGVFVLSIVFVLMLGTMESIQMKNQIDLVARRAVLLMETNGYIADSMEEELLQQLADVNVENAAIETRGFSVASQTWGSVDESSPAAYGQKIEVEITGTAKAAFGKNEGSGVFTTMIERSEVPIRVVRVSTSKN